MIWLLVTHLVRNPKPWLFILTSSTSYTKLRSYDSCTKEKTNSSLARLGIVIWKEVPFPEQFIMCYLWFIFAKSCTHTTFASENFVFFSVVNRENFLVSFGSNRIELIRILLFWDKDAKHSCLSTMVKKYGGWTGSSIDIIYWNSHSFFHTFQ